MIDAAQVRAALDQRVGAAAAVALADSTSSRTLDAAHLLPQLLATTDPAALWLTTTAVLGRYPEPALVARLRRGATAMERARLQLAEAATSGSLLARARVTTNVVFVAGIGECSKNRAVQLAASAPTPACAAGWTRTGLAADAGQAGRLRLCGSQTLLVPWRTAVVLIGDPPACATAAYTSLAEASGNRVILVSDGLAEIVHAERYPVAEIQAAARRLAPLRSLTRIVATSEVAAEQYRGFVEALTAQGLAGPQVSVLPLGSDPAAWGSLLRGGPA